MGRVIGYARVSTKEQNLERQLEALKKYVDADMIVTDKASGKDFNREGYQSLKVGTSKLVKGDTLYIKSLDRFSRNKEYAKKELKYFSNIGVRVIVIDLPTTMMDIPKGQEWILDMINNILIEVLTSVAENERTTIKQRQREGIDVMPVINGKRTSTKTNKPMGRPVAEFPQNWHEVYSQWKAGELTATKAMELLQLTRNTFYNLVKRFENK